MTFKTIRSSQKGMQKGAQIAIVRKQAPAAPAAGTILTFLDFSQFLEPAEQVFKTLLKQRLGRFRGTMKEWQEKFKEIKNEPVK